MGVVDEVASLGQVCPVVLVEPLPLEAAGLELAAGVGLAAKTHTAADPCRRVRRMLVRRG